MANKYDVFKDAAPEARKTMSRALRAIALEAGASLVYMTVVDTPDKDLQTCVKVAPSTFGPKPNHNPHIASRCFATCSILTFSAPSGSRFPPSKPDFHIPLSSLTLTPTLTLFLTLTLILTLSSLTSPWFPGKVFTTDEKRAIAIRAGDDKEEKVGMAPGGGAFCSP